jgi:uncharacterized protein YjbJ (UPF0337 family)
VADLHPAARAHPHRDRLADRVEQPVALVADVGGVAAALARGAAGEGDQFVGGEEGGGRIDEAGTESHRAVAHRRLHERRHAAHLVRGGAAGEVAHHRAPHRAGGDVGTEVDRRARALEVVEVAREGAPGLVGGRGRAGGAVGPGGGDLAGDLARDPLAHLGGGAGLAQDRGFGVAEHVDEARGDHAVLGVDHAAGAAGGAHRADVADAVAAHRDLAAVPRVAGAVHHARVGDEQVVARARAGGEGGAGGGRRGEEHGGERGSHREWCGPAVSGGRRDRPHRPGGTCLAFKNYRRPGTQRDAELVHTVGDAPDLQGGSTMTDNRDLTQDGFDNSVEGKATDLKGKVKDAVGGLTGNTSLQGEGKMDQAKGKIQDAFGQAERAVDPNNPRNRE